MASLPAAAEVVAVEQLLGGALQVQVLVAAGELVLLVLVLVQTAAAQRQTGAVGVGPELQQRAVSAQVRVRWAEQPRRAGLPGTWTSPPAAGSGRARPGGS